MTKTNQQIDFDERAEYLIEHGFVSKEVDTDQLASIIIKNVKPSKEEQNIGIQLCDLSLTGQKEEEEDGI